MDAKNSSPLTALLDAEVNAFLHGCEDVAKSPTLLPKLEANSAIARLVRLYKDQRAKVVEQASLIDSLRAHREALGTRCDELEAECADVRELLAHFEKMRHEERQTWASHSSSWALFHEEPDTWAPYVDVTLRALTEYGVPETIIKSMTPYPDAAERINAKNAAVKRIALDRLRQAMSDLSEECWYAGWLMGTEFELWRFVQNGPGEWGQGVVDQSDVDELKILSELCKGWFIWDAEDGETFRPMTEWLEMYEEHEKRYGYRTP